MPKSQLQIGLSQQLNNAIKVLSQANQGFHRLTPQQQARVLKQLAQVSGALQQALHGVLTGRPG